MWIIRPLVWTIEMLDKSFGHQTLQIAEENDVILAVEVDPTVVTVPGVVTLHLTRCLAVENLIERLAVDVAQFDTEVLAKRHITVTVDDKAAHDALTSEFQPSVAPFVIKSHKVKVLLRAVDASRNFGNEIRCREQFTRCVKEGHCSIDAYTQVHTMVLGNADYISHVIETVPWRETEHQRQRHLIFQCLHHLNYTVVTIAATHPLISLAGTIERDVQVARMMAPDGVNDMTGSKAIGKQGVVWMMLLEPRHDFRSLWMEDELATLQPYGRMACHTSAFHHLLNVID